MGREVWLLADNHIYTALRASPRQGKCDHQHDLSLARPLQVSNIKMSSTIIMTENFSVGENICCLSQKIFVHEDCEGQHLLTGLTAKQKRLAVV